MKAERTPGVCSVLDCNITYANNKDLFGKNPKRTSCLNVLHRDAVSAENVRNCRAKPSKKAKLSQL